jgi:hypothetical protein
MKMRKNLTKLSILWTVGLVSGLLAVGNSSAGLLDLRNLDSYVLFALDELDFKGGNTGDGTRGIIDGGNVGVNRADPTPGASGADMNIGANGDFVMSDGTHAVSDTMILGSQADVYDVFVNVEKGAFGGTIRNTKTTPIPDWNGGPLIPLADILARFQSAAPSADSNDDVSSSGTGTTWSLAPGVYRDVNSQDGTTLNLSAGEYDMRRLTLGQNVTVNMTDATILRIADDVRLNGADFGTNTTGLAQIYIGAGSGDNSQFGAQGEIWGQFFSLGNLRLGRANDLYGRFWAQQIGSDFNDNVTYIAPVPVPAAVWLFASGLIGLVGIARRRKIS